jgi:hypothetical protein
MELFILFLIACFIAGIALRDRSPRLRRLLLLATAFFLSLVYYVLERMM